MSLPAFRYHPDPLATGSVICSDARCACCGDGATFIGRAGAGELTALGPQAVASIRESTGLDEGAEWARLFAALDKDGSPTTYMFRRIHCGEFGGYQDCD
ncbi:CbrC family protein [Burkholderia sp. BCC0322]|uniref:CbrC family protein n=1 Tax=unclassified Burkholderia TaxID=2613784 RepID=UPI00158AA44A|nr:CbrC family protein [Burkholderia sp. BCC0322]